ncbi:MAG: FAD-dependent oxidoreductase [Streptococcaceae bacterium]|jgi:NADPH-dependent 2,4-dienoyl-CoA reductase/sulfur reductase-like enzyme|nr:FAD-dependent oxidoreductase [Streptococcaceae bacterium]
MKILIIGGVASGTSVAAKARRNDENAQIIIYDKDVDISYSVCGIPYAVGGEVDDFDQLTPRTPAFFKSKYNVDVYIGHEITKINHEKKEVYGTNLLTGEPFSNNYDILVFATGSRYHTPKAFVDRQCENFFRIKNITSGKTIQTYIAKTSPKTALIIGAGFIGLEMAEQLHRLGIKITLMTRGTVAMSHLDEDMAIRISDEMHKYNIACSKEEEVADVIWNEGKITQIVTTKGRTLEADLFIAATGVRPNVELAKSIGVKIGETGAIAVDSSMQTNLENVYAVGDCAETFNLITGKPAYHPMATTANKQGRIAGDAMTGGNSRHRGVLGTGILRFFDLTIAQTGLTQKQAEIEGFDPVILFNEKPDKPNYMGGKKMMIKAIADKTSRRLLGVQIIGRQGVDKRVDVFAALITMNAKVDDLFHLDLAYAPPFSITKDPVITTGMALTNALERN